MVTLPRAVVRYMVVLLVGLSAGAAQAQSASSSRRAEPSVDTELARYVASIAAIDNHAHTVLPPPNDTSDREFDALPVDSMEPQTDPVGLRADNPQLTLAWKALWNFDGAAPLDPEGTKRLVAVRARIKAREGVAYDDWVLSKVGVGTELSNRVRMGPLAPPRYLWVPYDDALLYPLNNSALAASTPDKAMFFPLEAKVISGYMRDAGLRSMPPTLDAYLAKLVLPTLQAQKRGGAVAIKFEVAYLRGFDFTAPSYDEAARVYAHSASGAVPEAADYKLLQDYLFRAVALEAGKLGMAVHLHTGEGAGSYFSLTGANPMLLEPVFNDPALRKTTSFVMLHGGWPYVQQAGSLLQKPNVYLDFSQQVLIIPPRTMAGWLREWLELYPDKVLYATDAYPYSAALGWEESLWIANRNAREALGIALTGMLRDGEIDRAHAEAIAMMVLRGNAAKLYAISAEKPR